MWSQNKSTIPFLIGALLYHNRRNNPAFCDSLRAVCGGLRLPPHEHCAEWMKGASDELLLGRRRIADLLNKLEYPLALREKREAIARMECLPQPQSAEGQQLICWSGGLAGHSLRSPDPFFAISNADVSLAEILAHGVLC